MTRRIVIAVAATVGIAAAAAFLADHYATGAVERNERTRLQDQTALLAEWVRDLGPGIDAQAFAERVAQALLARVTLIDAEGRVLGDSSQSRSTLAAMDNHAQRPELVAARAGVTGTSRRRSGTTHLEYLYSARRLPSGSPVAFVRIAVRAPGRSAEFRPSWIALFGSSGLIAGAVLAIGMAYARRQSRAAKRLAESVEAGARGRLREDGHAPELRRIAAAVERELGRADQSLRNAENRERVLNAAVEGMQEGLLLIDSTRKVRLANPAARGLFDIDFDPVGGQLAQVIRHPPLLDAVNSALDGRRTPAAGTLTYEAGDRAFEIRINPLDGSEQTIGVLVLLFDVTRIRALERVRQRFVSNVSHELRTPLTAIKAAVETILDDERFAEEPFALMIQRNAESIQDLIEDLTDLSLIETGAVTLDRTRFDLALLARETVEQLRPVAAGMPIEVAIDGALEVAGDRRRIRQVLVNLIDNAIKFNRPNQPIVVSGGVEGDDAVLRVRDRGIGIPASELEKVFHRFHQVADDRSRERPGSGLGLAIVKHLVRLHGGTIHAESELGAGSTFTLTLPQTLGPFDPDA